MPPTEYQDAEYTSATSNGALDYDPITGEVMDLVPVSQAPMQQVRGNQLARPGMPQERQQLALGMPQAMAMAVKEKALLECRLAIARERPRDWMVVRAKLLRECQRPGFADAAIYSKPVGGGKPIEGLSIRFAEACVQAMGNIRTTTEVVEDGARQVTYRLSVMDLESGVSEDAEIVLAKTVERKSVAEGRVVVGERENKQGQKTYLLLATEDELLIKKNAAASKLKRNAVLALVPADIKDECREVCEATLTNKAAKNPVIERNRLLDAFSALGISPKQVAEYLDKESAEAIGPVDVVRMRPIYQAIKDSETSWKELMEAKGGKASSGPPAPQAAAPVSSQAKAPAAAPEPSQAPQSAPSQDPIDLEVAAIRKALSEAKTSKERQPLLPRIQALPPAERKQLEDEYKAASKGGTQ